ncbi:ribonuclease Z [Candidatus Pacearchaeota archaeon]|nr:ribonuclease Z [Candidatus Pacearchaeota archaeon]
MIEVTFLGTSQAIPTARRNHTSILLRYKNEAILVDCGEGTQRQFRIAKLNPCKLTRILITHWHGDHVLGIPGLLQTLALNGYNKTLEIYGPRGTKRFVDFIYNMFVFAGKIKVDVTEIEGGTFVKTDDFSIEALPLQHGAPCLAYRFSESDKRRIDIKKIKKIGLRGALIGKLQKGESITFKGKTIKPENVSYVEQGKSIAFMLDTAVCDNCIKIAKDANLFISEATYSAELEEKAREYKHLTAKQAAEIAKKAKAEQLILTHVSQRYEKEEDKILDEARKVFKNTKLARDFMRVEI